MFLIGVAGASGSGKTTFAHKIVERVASEHVAVISQDRYYLARDLYPAHLSLHNGGKNNDHPDAFDWALLATHLATLKEGRPVALPEYDFKTGQRLPHSRPFAPPDVLILEGIFALWDPGLCERMDLRIFIEVEADIRLIRRLHRDISERGRTIEDVIQNYYETVRPMHLKYIQPTMRASDLIVGEENDRAASVVADRIRGVVGSLR